MYREGRMHIELEEEEFFDKASFVGEEDVGIDLDYEFDAAKYYDFTKPETDIEAREAELWFETAPGNPPSPYLIKSNWRVEILLKGANSSAFSRDGENMDPNVTMESVITPIDDNGTGLVCNRDGVTQDVTKAKFRSPLSKNSNFMNPTASQLAKQNLHPNVHCDRLLRRFKKLMVQNGEQNSPKSSYMNGTQATKRQKLESGYLCKVARLKHQASFLHKAPKKVGQLDSSTLLARPKSTIPREPNLRTAYRAAIHRSKTVLESAEHARSNLCKFKARPLNRKILNAPSLPVLEKASPQQPRFQVFHLRTLERAKQHASVNAANIPESMSVSQYDVRDSKRINTVASLKEKPEALYKSRLRCLTKKELNSPIDEGFPAEPPVESFSKLSLATQVHSNVKPQSNMPMHSNTTNALQRLDGYPYQCGSHPRMRRNRTQVNISRGREFY